MKLSKVPALVAMVGLAVAPVAAQAGKRAEASVPARTMAAVAPATTSVTERQGAKLRQSENLVGVPLLFIALGVAAAAAVVVAVAGDASEGT